MSSLFSWSWNGRLLSASCGTAELSTRIRSAQLRAAFAVSRELVLLYWSIGREILARQQTEGWGARVIDGVVATSNRKPPLA